MGRLPAGVVWRGREAGAYYTRVRKVWRRLGATEDEMRRALARVHGETRTRAAITVAEFAERWLRESVARERNDKGRRLAETRVRQYLKPLLGAVRVVDVTPERLRQYGHKLANHEWKPKRLLSTQTVRHVLSDARAMFLWAVDIEILDRSPVPRRLLPKVPESQPDPFTDEERALLVALPGADGFTVRLGIGTGLRWGELVSLQSKHVRGRVVTILTPKNGRVRRIQISPALAEELGKRVGTLLPWRYSQLWAFTERVRRLTGIERFHAHRMRDDFACRWLERGGSIAALKKMLGHSSVLVTERYARLDDDMIGREAERVFRDELCPNGVQKAQGTALTEDSAAC